MEKISDFKSFVSNTTEIILLDLEKLKQIAENVNQSAISQTTTSQTTIIPNNNSFSQDSEKISRCAIPITMVCFSTINMIGQWLNEKPDDDFGNCALSFFSKLSRKDDLKNNNATKKLKTIFRNGIMHSFFAIQGFGVTYPTYESNSLFLDIENKDGSALNVKYLLKIVEIGLENLNKELANEESTLSISALKGYESWVEKWKSI